MEKSGAGANGSKDLILCKLKKKNNNNNNCQQPEQKQQAVNYFKD